LGDWAQQQLDRANRTLNPKARNDRLALAEYYLQLAEQERADAKRLKPAVAPAADTGKGPFIYSTGVAAEATAHTKQAPSRATEADG
jgi:hypothetical protein